MLISIIIPIYNSKKYLKSCIRSVTNQTFRDIEIILVDDASTDGSSEICDEVAKSDDKIKVIHHAENKGLSISKYDGYRLSTGDYISFIDNDDLIAADMYKKLVQMLSNNPDADMLCIAGNDIRDNEMQNTLNTINKGPKTNNKEHNCSGIDACKAVYMNSNNSQKRVNRIANSNTDFMKLHGIFSATWGKIIRRDLFDKTLRETIQYKDELYWVFLEDVLYIPICFYNATKVVISTDVCYLHRISNVNLSARKSPSDYHYETVQAQDIVQDFYRLHNLEDVADAILPGFMLLLQSTWYKIYRNESNPDKRQKGLLMIESLWEKNIKNFKRLKSNSNKLAYMSSYVFDINKRLWYILIGRVYFG